MSSRQALIPTLIKKVSSITLRRAGRSNEGYDQPPLPGGAGNREREGQKDIRCSQDSTSVRPKDHLSALPYDLHHLIFHHLTHPDANSLLQCNRTLYRSLNPILYRQAAQNPATPALFALAITPNASQRITELTSHGADPNVLGPWAMLRYTRFKYAAGSCGLTHHGFGEQQLRPFELAGLDWPDGPTPLHLALIFHRPENVNALLQAGANVGFGRSVLHVAVCYADVESLGLVLKQPGVKLDSPRWYWDPITSHKHAIRTKITLADYQPPLNAAVDVYGGCIRCGHYTAESPEHRIILQKISLLLESGCDVNQRAKDTNTATDTALMRAIQISLWEFEDSGTAFDACMELVELLLREPEKVNFALCDDRGRTVMNLSRGTGTGLMVQHGRDAVTATETEKGELAAALKRCLRRTRVALNERMEGKCELAAKSKKPESVFSRLSGLTGINRSS